MKFLVKETTYFVDGHGTPSNGGTEKYITGEKIYQYADPNKYYRAYEFEYIKNSFVEESTKEDIEEFFKDNGIIVNQDRMGAEDGYNCVVCKYVVEKITDEKAEEIQHIIEEYNDI